MKFGAIIIFFFGVILIWLGLNGKLGVFLASFFTPKAVKLVEKDENDTFIENETPQSFTGTGLSPTGLLNNSMGNINY
jgi:hypothetical protein